MMKSINKSLWHMGTNKKCNYAGCCAKLSIGISMVPTIDRSSDLLKMEEVK